MIAHRRKSKRRLRRGIIFGSVAFVVLGLAFVVGWVGIRGLEAKNALERAEGLVGQLKSEALSNPEQALGLVGRIQAQTAIARDRTGDPVWRVAESTPAVGVNLRVVRELADAVDDVSVGALKPLAGVASTLDVDALKPVDGRINLQPIVDAKDSIAVADDALVAAGNKVKGIDDDGSLGMVSTARTRLEDLLTEAAAMTGSARTLTQLVPPMLGADAPRNYLLLFQNNAEARSLGGNPAALVLVRVDQGGIAIVQQASSGDFKNGVASPIELDPNLAEVYYPSFPAYVQDIGTRPDFPTMARLAQGYWEQEFGLHVDGVVSFDPVALAGLLDATGPVKLPTGQKLSSDNAVQLLLSDVYAMYEDPDDQDAFFAAAAGSIFGAITDGGFKPADLLDELTEATNEGRLMVWSDHPEEQEIIAPLTFSGILPDDNSESTTLGVYFEDMSASKIDYYVGTDVKVASDLCTNPSTPNFSSTVTLSSLISQEDADDLPPYVLSQHWGSAFFKTDVYVVGPPGSQFKDWSVDAAGARNELISSGSDLGRPVVRVSTDLLFGTSTTMTFNFTSTAGDYGPVAVDTTPMVVPTTVGLPEACATGDEDTVAR